MGWGEMKPKTRDNEQCGRVRAFVFSPSAKNMRKSYLSFHSQLSSSLMHCSHLVLILL